MLRNTPMKTHPNFPKLKINCGMEQPTLHSSN
jgi:hypothetical protein